MVATFVTKMLISVTPASSPIDRHRARQRHPRDDERQRGADDRAEHGEQDQHRDRQADELGPNEVLLDRLVELVLHDRDAGHRGLDASGGVHQRRQVLGIVDGVLHVLVQPKESDGLVAVLAEERRVADVGVGEDLVDDRLIAQRRDRSRPPCPGTRRTQRHHPGR